MTGSAAGELTAWHVDGFCSSLTAAAAPTISAYRSDLTAFVEWADRLGLPAPGSVDHRVLRRYLAYLSTRRFARRTVARKASSLRRYFGWLARSGCVSADPSLGLRAPKGDGRLPQVLGHDELHGLLDDLRPERRRPPRSRPPARGAEATRRRRARSCSTAAASGSPSCAACGPATSSSPVGGVTRVGQGRPSSGRCR